jgi:hypothetical protein
MSTNFETSESQRELLVWAPVACGAPHQCPGARGGDAGSMQPGPTRSPAPGDKRPDNSSVWLVILVGLVGVGLLIVCTVTTAAGLCQVIMQFLFLMLLSGSRDSSRGRGSLSGGRRILRRPRKLRKLVRT